jgi:hypothetical protein
MVTEPQARSALPLKFGAKTWWRRGQTKQHQDDRQQTRYGQDRIQQREN